VTVRGGVSKIALRHLLTTPSKYEIIVLLHLFNCILCFPNEIFSIIAFNTCCTIPNVINHGIFKFMAIPKRVVRCSLSTDGWVATSSFCVHLPPCRGQFRQRSMSCFCTPRSKKRKKDRQLDCIFLRF